MSYWLDMVDESLLRESADRTAARLVQSGADLREVAILDAAKADRLLARMAAARSERDGGAA